MRNVRKLLMSAFMVVGLAVPMAALQAAGSSGGSSSGSSGGSGSTGSSTTEDYAKAKNKIAAGSYDSAISILEKIVRKQPSNADAFNLLGYSHRKLGRYDEALEYYQDALKLEPAHIGANEYLGELYLEMKDLPKAEERLAVLTKACDGCEEQKELEEKIAAYKAANS
ncbi:MAG: tetratricopeptide repeat protein [Dongiaceae bacterium]